MSNDSEQIIATLSGLNDWYTHIFKIAGWMILAKHRSIQDVTVTDNERYQTKVNSYIGGIVRLQKHLNKRLPNSNGTVRYDFPIMIENLIVLMNFINQINPSDLSVNISNIKNDYVCKHKTLHDLQCWYKRMFEKYGWIILKSEHLNNMEGKLKVLCKQKIRLYGKTLRSLLQSLNFRYNNCQGSDNSCDDLDPENIKQDLMSMMKNVSILLGCYNMHIRRKPTTMTSESSSESPKRTSSIRVSPARELPIEAPVEAPVLIPSAVRVSPARELPIEAPVVIPSAARVSPARVSPARVSPARVSPARVSPARVSPARVSPARVSTESDTVSSASSVSLPERTDSEQPNILQRLSSVVSKGIGNAVDIVADVAAGVSPKKIISPTSDMSDATITQLSATSPIPRSAIKSASRESATSSANLSQLGQMSDLTTSVDATQRSSASRRSASRSSASRRSASRGSATSTIIPTEMGQITESETSTVNSDISSVQIPNISENPSTSTFSAKKSPAKEQTDSSTISTQSGGSASSNYRLIANLFN